MNFRKFTHKIYHYPQQQLLTYRVTEGVSAATGNKAVTAAARQYSVSKYIHSLNSLFNTQKQYTVSNTFSSVSKYIHSLNSLFNTQNQCTVSNIFTHRFKSNDRRRRLRRRRLRLQRQRRTRCSTMKCECKTLSKLLYIYCKTLILHCAQAPS